MTVRPFRLAQRIPRVVIALAVGVGLGGSLLMALYNYQGLPRLIANTFLSIAFSLLASTSSARLVSWFNSVRGRTDAATGAGQGVATLRKPTRRQFTGREAELSYAKREHDRYRKARSGPDTHTLGPVVLAIHGPPGVGKTALAFALAKSLREEYRNGFYAANFGAGGTTRGPADIARDFLLQLGWTPSDMPDETEDRVATLRSLTRGKRMLFLFDAARDHDQVRQVIPAEGGCAVIITSRREIASSLGFAPHDALGYTTPEDSLKIFTEISGYDWTRDAETAVEIVELCGRLPLAIRSAAERVRDGTDVRHVAELLRPAGTRLSALDYGGRTVEERIDSEYRTLSPQQRAALALLTTIDSDTFVPWVLRPLLNLPQRRESSGVVAALAAAQLVEKVDADDTGQPRYRMNSLVRLFASAKLASMKDDLGVRQHWDVGAARRRLDDAYLDLIDDVLTEVDVTYRHVRGGRPRRWRSDESAIATRIPKALDQLVRREYANLIRIIEVSDVTTYAGLIWRVASLLGGVVPAGADRERLSQAFDRAAAAALHDGSPVGEVDVRLTQAQFLVAVEDYHAAFAVLSAANDNLDELVLLTADPPLMGVPPIERRLRAARIWAFAYVQVGSFHEATRVLAEVDNVVAALPDDVSQHPAVQTELRLLTLFNASTRRLPKNSPRWEAILDGASEASDTVTFRTWLERSEEMRRRRHWADAADQLREERLRRDGDARGIATVKYRLARLYVDEAQDLVQPDHHPAEMAAADQTRLARHAVRHAAQCAVVFGTIGDEVGQIRARCMLVRALVVADQLMAATQLCMEIGAYVDTEKKERPKSPSLLPTRARFARARGELQLAYGAYQSACQSFSQAVAIFAELHDWANHADTWRLLDRVRRQHPSAVGDALHSLDAGGWKPGSG